MDSLTVNQFKSAMSLTEGDKQAAATLMVAWNIAEVGIKLNEVISTLEHFSVNIGELKDAMNERAQEIDEAVNLVAKTVSYIGDVPQEL